LIGSCENSSPFVQPSAQGVLAFVLASDSRAFLLCVSRELHPSSFELVVFWRRQTFIRRGEERARDRERDSSIARELAHARANPTPP